jgi:hypothetical protein
MPSFSRLGFCSKIFKHAKSTFVGKRIPIHSFIHVQREINRSSFYHDPIDDGHAILMA